MRKCDGAAVFTVLEQRAAWSVTVDERRSDGLWAVFPQVTLVTTPPSCPTHTTLSLSPPPSPRSPPDEFQPLPILQQGGIKALTHHPSDGE